MAKPTYYELLRHPMWQEKRLRIMDRAKFRCENCATKDVTLNVHHKRYRKGAKPWEYQDSELVCLCENCHETEHEWREHLTTALTKLSPAQLEELVGFAEGMVAGDVTQDFIDYNYEDPPLKPGWKEIRFPIRSDIHAVGFLMAIGAKEAATVHVDRVTEAGHVNFMEVLDSRWCRDA